ncbi:mRNA triphosphatase CET1 [Canariomyces notabilis]|uniref:mRNA-capping enzyme subunit beta n=1 Tax=Canariomyces notabilis TaxID=2074819 RepID=A0AAN6YQQ0_9PEZI|nr:mRNA triphosphatase CET1 [Canariomyces arenarius]
MDLRGMLNDSGPTAPRTKLPQPPGQPLAQQQQAHSQAALPSTPVQTNPQQSFRDFAQTQPSPSRHISQEYESQHVPAVFASPPPFPAAAPGPYPNQPPPLQQFPPNDLRSPSVGAGPVPSPFRQTPTPSISSAGGYPFPTQQTPTSPVQRHQFPPAPAYHRDSYPQPPGPAVMTGPPATAPYMQGPRIPQTPPIATPGATQPYLHRSQSAQSTPTPTSAHSQHAQYGAPFTQGSPVATPRPLPQVDQQQRQSSQPPTPGAAVPLSARPAQVVGYGQPPSPYQQRLPGNVFHPVPQASPALPPPPPALPRHSITQGVYDPQSQEPHRGQQPQSDRERSVSVSPKTRVPSLPSTSGRPSTSATELEARHSQAHHTAMTASIEHDAKRDRAATPAKRKLEDRELQPEELERRDTRPAPFEDSHGRAGHADAGGPVPRPHMPIKAQKKRKVYRTVPPWAQSLRDRVPTHPNYVLARPLPHSGPQVNGKPDRQAGRPEQQPLSRHQSPEEKRSMAPQTPGPNVLPETANPWGPLGPWEASITNSVPQEGFTKAIADFLFQYIILNPDINEIQGRGVKFEIEAKLGTLISKDTNQRLNLPVLTECVINDGGNWLGFRSSMTEIQHKSFNEFLNLQVQQTHPNNKANAALPRPRLPIDYLHRHEIDRFFDLPPAVRDRELPVCVAKPIATRGHGARVRVTYDQKTNKVLAKIIKARVADVSLHFPDQPLDCRISVNLEMDWDGSVEELERLSGTSGGAGAGAGRQRVKDRLSYRHGCYQIDLTQVTQNVAGPGNTQRQEKEHELEVEVDPVALIDQGRRARESQPHQYLDLVEGLVNNIRILARKAREFGT